MRRAGAAALAVTMLATAFGGLEGRADSAAAVERLAGGDRYETAAAVSRAAFPDGAPVAFLASGATFPDALAAAPVAAGAGGPVLLAGAGELPPATREELARLDPERVVVIGGTAAIGEDVAVAAGATERVVGGDRYETAAALAERLRPAGGPIDAVYLAAGGSFADAVSGAAPAARDGAPILLTVRTALPAATAAQLRRLRPRTTIVLGGPSAVDRGVDAEVAAITGGAVGRSEGRDRWATSAAVAANAYAPGTPVVHLASGTEFADGLAGAVLAARNDGPVLLTPPDCLPVRAADQLARLGPARVVLLGGDGAVGPATVLDRPPCAQAHDPRPVTPERPMTVLYLGDSMATEPFYSLERLQGWFGGTLVPVKRNEPGTGFNRPDVFDWEAAAPRLMAEHDPDVVTMIIGANDTDAMSMPDGRMIEFASDEWRAEYARRVGAVMDALAVDGRLVVWASQPLMGREPLSTDVAMVSDLVRDVAAGRGVVWLDTRPLFSDGNGRYVNNGWRMPDEVHFTPAGGDRLVGAQLDVILSRWRP